MDYSNVDFTKIITTVINDLLNLFFTSFDNNIYSILDDITFIDSSIINNNNLLSFFGSSSNHGIVLITLSILIGFILYYSIKLFYSYYFSNSYVQNPLQFFIKVIIISIIIIYSYFICEQILEINSNISLAIRNIGEYYLDKNICFYELNNYLNNILNINSSDFNIFSLDGIIKSIASSRPIKFGIFLFFTFYNDKSFHFDISFLYIISFIRFDFLDF